MICYRCMRMSTQNVCEHCGFDFRAYTPLPFALKPGSLLHKHYLLGTVIGSGGFGITYIGYDNVEQRRIAVKEFYPSSVVSRDIRVSNQVNVNDTMRQSYQKGVQKFYNEAAVMAQLNGIPTIVSIFDFFYENNTAYIVMEYIDGTGVDKIIQKQGPLPIDMVLTIYYPILEALREVHNSHLLHRDISPSNIMLDERIRPRLIDFGASRAYSGELSTDLTVILKHGFAPLEQYTRKGHHGPAEDIYALSASMYYTLTGKVPPMATDRIRFDTLQPFSAFAVEVPASIESVIMKGLAPLASNRYQSAEEMLSDLDHALTSNTSSDVRDETAYDYDFISKSETNHRGISQSKHSMMNGVLIGAAAIIILLAVILVLLLMR